MDETPVSGPPAERLREGFTGQRMLVVPRPAVHRALTQPVIRRLLVTDVGVFPHAARHGRSRPNGAAQHILLVCTDGSGWCRTPEGGFRVARGDAVLLPAREAHEYGASDADPWTVWWSHVTGADAAELVRAARASAGGPRTHLRDPAPVASLISQAIDALDGGTTTAGLTRAAGLAWNALAHVIATGRRSPGPSLTPFERAVEHLRATTPQRTSVTALAAMVGLGPSQLGELFRHQLGISPLKYQTELRMARARELLDSSDETVTCVARAAGYDDAMYFSRQFARVHGMSPTAYRTRPADT
ncbi:helix-turn-helix domain-containing protein [uncultured Cellulomonas sp.]|uniref:helix-turn-helix domain-containing protein n=1 Tax=uncultured Cellulomonas sp. TaxID=189682 RepID=UPI0026080696|nr:helix-turn-helix domain-containing protein [uncultured Cellulomonas sp.]